MQRSSSRPIKNIYNQIIHRHNIIQQFANKQHQPCDVFINHRGIDTKRNVAGLLYDHLTRLGLRAFLDSKNMKPGDKLFDKIGVAIRKCRLGVAVFSPQYCQSYFCLHELCLMMESKKRVIPIFCDVKPSELRVKENVNGMCRGNDIERFNWALDEARNTVGLSFDTSSGDWPELLESASDAVMKNLFELEAERLVKKQQRLRNPRC